MDDALYDWNREVQNSTSEAESLSNDIDTVRHALESLVRTIRDLKDVRFPEEQDYNIRRAANQLWDSTSRGTQEVRRHLDDARASINDLRRVVDFYSHQ